MTGMARLRRRVALLAAMAVLLPLVAVSAAAQTPPGDPPAAPVKPTGLKVESEPGSLEVDVDWDDTTDADDYLVRWRLAGPGNELNEGERVPASEATVTVDGVGSYVVRVQACNNVGCGPPAATTVEVEPAVEEPTTEEPAQEEEPATEEPAQEEEPATEEDSVGDYARSPRSETPVSGQQDTPTLPSACPAPILGHAWTLSPTSTSTSITVTTPGKGGLPVFADQLRICDSSGTVTVVKTGLTVSEEVTITKLGTANDSPALTAGTDYWIQAYTTSPAYGGGYQNKGGPWAYIRTVADTPTVPSFTDGATKTLTVASGATAGTLVGTVAATDTDGDTLEYSLTGSQSPQFAIDDSGVITVASGRTLGVAGTYSITARVTDGEDADGNAETGAKTIDDTIALTIRIVPAQTPAVPTGLTVTQTELGGSLDVSWTGGTTGVQAVSDYDIRFYAGTADPLPADVDDWVEPDEANLGGHDHMGAATEATITGLKASTAYRVQVRATNSAGTSAWSSSATATTIAAAATNNAPKALKLNAAMTACEAVTSPETKNGIAGLNASAGTLINATLTTRGSETTEFPTTCTQAGTKEAPVFDDRDGIDDLSFTWEWVTLPDHVILLSDEVRQATVGGKEVFRFWLRGAAARQPTGTKVLLTVTDPHGASVSTNATFSVKPFVGANTSTPSFSSTVANQAVVKDAAMTALVLPTATGGDVSFRDVALNNYQFPYLYAVSGLPTGLTFNAETRTISGTPTAAFGTYTVTYTAQDADDTTTEADTASQSFKMIVSDAATAIVSAELTSSPSIDTNADGVADTYGVGEIIEVTITFNDSVSWDVSAAGADVRTRFQWGSREASVGLERGGATSGSGRSLVFRLRPGATDSDTDGITVIPVGTDLIQLISGATLTKTGGGAVSRRHAGTAADAGHKVDGTMQPDTAGPYPVGVAVSTTAVTVTFNEALNPDSVPAASAFTVTVAGTAAAPTAVAVNSTNKKQLDLTLASAPQATDSVTVRYAKPAMDPLRDGGGNEVDSFGPISRPTDYDTDNDQLIEISTATQLNAIRWDRNGDGAVVDSVDTAGKVGYLEAFNPAANQCDPDTTDMTEVACAGYELANDIDLNTAPFNTGSGWVPIEEYRTKLAGNNHKISNLFIDRSAETAPEGSGLFRTLHNASVVEDLGLEGVSITAANAGALAHVCLSCTVSRVWATGTVTAVRRASVVGGLVALSRGTISNSVSAVAVSGAGTDPGGTAITGHTKFGGLVGELGDGTITNSYAVGSVTVAGGSVSNVGGLVGVMDNDDSAVTNSYSTGAVSASSGATGVGGLTGPDTSDNTAATVTGSFWDTTTSGQSSSTGGTGKTTAELQAPTAPGTNAGDVYHGWAAATWDFGSASQYPVLKGHPLSAAAQRELFADINLSVNPVAITENGGAQQVTVTATMASGTASARTTVNLSFAGTATKGTDYTISPASPTVVINNGASSGTATVTFTPTNNSQAAGNKTIRVSGTATGLKVGATSLALNDDDTPSTSLTLSASPDSLGESAASTAVTVTATLDGATLTSNVTVTLAALAGTAAKDTDYTVAETTLPTITISAGSASGTATVNIDPTQDTLDEGTGETIVFDGTATGSLTVNEGALTITDDDATPTIIDLSASPTSIGEGDSATTVTITATLRGSATRTTNTVVTLGTSLGGNATKGAMSGNDYSHTALPTSITINAGSPSGTASTFTVTPIQDTDSEGTETITLGGTSSGFTVNAASIDFADDDLPVITLAVDVNPGMTGNQTTLSETAASTTVTLTATRAMATASSAVVTLSWAGTATEGTDYATITSKPTSITIRANQTTASTTFTIDPTADVIFEGDETVVISGEVGDGTTYSVDAATVTITDNWTEPTEISWRIDGAGSITESSAATSVRVSLWSKNGFAVAADKAFTLALSGTATTGTGKDYTHGTLPTITIFAGGTAANGTFTVTPIQDTLDEGTGETIIVTPTAPAGLTMDPATRSFTLADDDATPTIIDLSASDTSVGEGETAATTITIKATLKGSATRTEDTVVTLETSLGGTATAGQVSGNDYTLGGTLPTSITISAGRLSGTASSMFTITPIQDTDSEPKETITLAGSACMTTANPCPATDRFTVNAASIDFVDDDLPVITLGLGTTSRAESASSTGVVVTASRDTAITTKAVTVTLTLTGNAVRNTDYTASGTLSVTIPQNQPSATLTIFIDPTSDKLSEGDETVIFGGTATGFNVSPATFTITDVYTASTSIALSVNPTSVAETATAKTVVVTATVNDGAPTSNVSVALGTLTGTATSGAGKDYTFSPTTLPSITISANQTSGTASVAITPVADVIDEGSGETIIFSGSTTDAGFTGGVSSATVTLTDNDNAPSGITLSLLDSSSMDLTSVAEDDGATTVTVKATVTGGTTFATQKVVTVSVAGSGTATAVDFATVANFNITIPAGSASAMGTFTLTPTDDVVDETTETITVGGTLAGVAVTGDTLSLTDDDNAPTGITLSANPATVSEAAAKTVTVTATVTGGTTYATARTVTVSVDGSGTATAVDFTAVDDFTINIAAGSASAMGTFTLTPTNDVIDETDETITISGTSSGVTVTSGTLALTDDDPTPSGITLTLDKATVREDATGTDRTVTVTAAVNGTTRYVDAKTVTVSVDGSGTASAVDFTAVSDFDITIAAGAASNTGTFTLVPDNDETDETHETITVSGSSGTISVTSATLELRDNDGASGQIDLSVSADSLAEAAGSTTITVTAKLDASALASATTVTLALDEANSTAKKGTDFADPGTLATITIEADAKSGTATVNLDPTQDNLDEGTGETIRIGGTHSGSLTVTSVDVTITDDDDTPTDVDLSVSPTSVSETDTSATTITVSARLRGAATRTTATPVTLDSTLGGTATVGAGNDYTHSALSATTITIPEGQFGGSTTVTFDVTPLQDPAYEGAETIQVLGLTTVGGLTVNAATLQLNDADVPRIDLSVDTDSGSAGTQTTIREDDRAQTVTITATHAPETSDDDKAKAVRVTVMVGTSGSSAGRGADGDYTSAETVNVTIPAGRDSGTARVTIRPRQDDEPEGSETIVFSGQVGDGTEFQVAPTQMTLLDDETPSTGIVLLVNRDSIAERASSTAVRVTAKLNGQTLAANSTVTLALGGNATIATNDEDNDYSVRQSPLPTIEIGAGKASAAVTVHIDPEDDLIDELDGETVRFTGTHSANLAVAPVDVTIADDDTASTIIALSVDTDTATDGTQTTVNESGGGTAVAVTITAKLAGTVTRNEATTVALGSALAGTATSGADYAHASLPASIIIAAGQSSASVTGLTITPTQDAAPESVETIIVNGTLAGFKVHGATVWLVDDETDAPGVPGEFEARLSGANSVRLSWEEPTAPDDDPVTAYRLERRTDRSEWEIVSGTISDTARGHTDGGLEYETAYWWRLAAQNEDGRGPATEEIEVVTRSRPRISFGGGGGGGGGPGGGGPGDEEEEESEEPEETETPDAPPALGDVNLATSSARDILRAIRSPLIITEEDRADPARLAQRLEAAKPVVRLWQALSRHCPALILTDEYRRPAHAACLNTIANLPPAATPQQAATRVQVVTLLARLWKENGPT